jgi:sugar/nucleoside kinase (ribokinase family)
MKTVTSRPRRGLLAAGNWLVDRVKLIDVYPPPEQLATITGETTGTGGGPYNVLVDLAQSGAPFPLAAAGLVGQDETGAAILADCRRRRIDTRFLGQTGKAFTSYTDVMTERATGRRTFFHARGANALWDAKGLDFKKTSARIFHLGYLLALDALDVADETFGTRAGKLLAAARAAGLKTSADVLSENSDRFAQLVRPALPQVDYLILNEFEAGKTAGFKVRTPEGRLDAVALRHAAGALLQQGVRELVVIHFPEGALARNRRGADVWQPALKLPPKYIAGTAGAGDAFCAGVLWGLHEGWELPRALRVGVCMAAACLSDPTCTAGVKSLQTSLALAKRFGFQAHAEFS